jgi:hypothetical protein
LTADPFGEDPQDRFERWQQRAELKMLLGSTPDGGERTT